MDASTISRVNSVALFKDSWALLKFTGIGVVGINRDLLFIYRALFYLVICVLYPIHLVLGIFSLENKSEFVSYMAFTTTGVLVVFKHFCLRFNEVKMRRIEELLGELDTRVKSVEERVYFQMHIRKRARFLLRTFVHLYTAYNITEIGMWLLQRKRHLLFVAWFPFDWQHSDRLFGLACAFQILGLTSLVIINMNNDSYTPLSIAILVGHVRLLAMRVQRMAYDSKDNAEAVSLRMCIEEHKKLVNIFNLLHTTVSGLLFAQIVSSGVICAMSMLYVVFFAESIFMRVFYTAYAFSMFFQNFPACYYGSVLEKEFDEITYAIFSSNWTNQQRVYRHSLLIFMLQTMQPIQLIAGKMIPVNINTYIKMLRIAYSFFALGVQF